MTPADSEAPSLWRFIPLSQYVRPPEPVTARMRRGLLGVWDRLRHSKKPPENRFGQLDWQPVREELLLQAAAEPDWQEAVPALDEVFKDWLKSGGVAQPLQVLVGTPYSGTCFTVSQWAGLKNWRVLEPPGAEQLISGNRDWFKGLEAEDSSPWVIPCLEKWFLRHFNGLTIIRELLERLSARQQPTLVVCDSWAWAYLNLVVHLDVVLPYPLVLAGFDQECLSRWFTSLTRFGKEHPWVFRLPDGALVLPSSTGETENEGVKIADFLGKVASYSRGIPGVAWAVWRHSIRLAPAPKKEEEAAPSEEFHTMWVSPWEYLNLPRVPEENQGRFALILHTLLLHRGVSNQLLPELLPGLAAQLGQDLQRLRAAGLVEIDQKVWRVSALGYPAVRQFLQSEEYLMDAI